MKGSEVFVAKIFGVVQKFQNFFSALLFVWSKIAQNLVGNSNMPNKPGSRLTWCVCDSRRGRSPVGPLCALTRGTEYAMSVPVSHPRETIIVRGNSRHAWPSPTSLSRIARFGAPPTVLSVSHEQLQLPSIVTNGGRRLLLNRRWLMVQTVSRWLLVAECPVQSWRPRNRDRSSFCCFQAETVHCVRQQQQWQALPHKCCACHCKEATENRKLLPQYRHVGRATVTVATSPAGGYFIRGGGGGG